MFIFRSPYSHLWRLNEKRTIVSITYYFVKIMVSKHAENEESYRIKKYASIKTN